MKNTVLSERSRLEEHTCTWPRDLTHGWNLTSKPDELTDGRRADGGQAGGWGGGTERRGKRTPGPGQQCGDCGEGIKGLNGNKKKNTIKLKKKKKNEKVATDWEKIVKHVPPKDCI